MKKVPILSITSAAILIGLACPLALGQASRTANAWDFEFTPYLWMPELDADVQLGGLSGSAEMDFSDPLDFVEFAGLARLAAWKQKWGLLFDASYMDLGADYSKVIEPGGGVAIGADVDVRQAFFDFGPAYRLIDTSVGEGEGQRLTLEPLGGVRYAYLKQELRLDVAVAGIGGIGSASDLTWNFLAGVDYELSDKMSFKAGHRILDIDYEGKKAGAARSASTGR